MGVNLEKKRDFYLNTAQCSDARLIEDYHATQKAPLTDGIREHRNMLIAALRRRGLEVEVEKVKEQQRQDRRTAMIEEAATLSAIPEDRREGNQNFRLNDLQARMMQNGTWKEVQKRVLQPLVEQATKILSTSERKRSPDDRTALAAAEITLRGQNLWDAAERKAMDLCYRRAVEILSKPLSQWTADELEERRELERTLDPARFRRAETEAEPLRRKAEAAAAPSSGSSYPPTRRPPEALTQKRVIRLGNPETATVGEMEKAIEDAGHDFRFFCRKLRMKKDDTEQFWRSLPTLLRGTPLRVAADGSGTSLHRVVNAMNADLTCPLQVVFGRESQADHGAEAAGERRVIRLGRNARIGDLREAMERALGSPDFDKCCYLAGLGMKGDARNFFYYLKINVSGRTLTIRDFCAEYEISWENVVEAINGNSACPVRIEIGGDTEKPDAAQKIARIGDPNTITIAGLRQAVEAATGTDLKAFCVAAAQKTHGDAHNLLLELWQERPRKTLRIACGDYGITPRELMAAINASRCGFRIEGGAAEEASEKKTVALGDPRTITCNDIAHAMHWREFCNAIRRVPGVRDLYTLLMRARGTERFDTVCGEVGLVPQDVFEVLNRTPDCPFSFSFEGSDEQEEGGERAGENPKREISIRNPEKITIGALGAAIVRSGLTMPEFYEAIRVVGGKAASVGFEIFDLGVEDQGRTFYSICRDFDTTPQHVIEQVNGSRACPIFLSCGGGGQPAESDDDERQPKRLILFSSNRMGGREIREAVTEAGVNWEEFLEALEDADFRVNGAEDLANELRSGASEGRRAREDEKNEANDPILEDFSRVIDDLNEVEGFPYSLAFVLHGTTPLAEEHLSMEQVWYLQGMRNRVEDPETVPGRNLAAAEERGSGCGQAYRYGWDGVNCPRYFSWKGEHPGLKKAMGIEKPSVSLPENVPLRQLLKRLQEKDGGGELRLLAVLQQHQVPPWLWLRVQLQTDEPRDAPSAVEIFADHGLDRQWMEKHLGITFTKVDRRKK